jgi:hypothetical protein
MVRREILRLGAGVLPHETKGLATLREKEAVDSKPRFATLLGWKSV